MTVTTRHLLSLYDSSQVAILRRTYLLKFARLLVCFSWALLPASQTRLFAQTQRSAQSLHTLDTIHRDAKLLSLTPDGEWSFAVGENKTQFAAERIVRWGAWTGVLDNSAVWLADDSLVCGDLSLSATGVALASDWLDVSPLAWNTVRGLVLTPPRTLDNWLVLQTQMQAVEGDEDALWLTNGTRLKGIVRWDDTFDAAAGQTLGIDVSRGDVNGGDASGVDASGGDASGGDAGGQTIRIPLPEIKAIVFSPALLGRIAEQRDAMWLSLQDGSRLKTTRIDSSPTGVQLTLANGSSLKSLDFPEQFVSSIVGLARPSAVGIQFLSSLSPASYRHLPDSALSWELGVDRDAMGAALHTRQEIFERGLATHSVSQVAYRWDGSSARLLAEVRLAAAPPGAAERLGSVACKILVARGGELQTVHAFELQRAALGQAPPVELVDVALHDAKLIVLVTDKSDYGQYGDHVLWLDARLMPVQK